MSLVGNLEDLSLGDIMQIISLSQKSGVLALKAEEGAGRIVFRAGLVHAACLEGQPDDLRGLLVASGSIDETTFDAFSAHAEKVGCAVAELLVQKSDLTAEKIDALLRDSVESSILEMFTWRSGDFSFDVRSQLDPADPQVVLSTGVNAQYLAMEGMRICDERSRDEAVAVSDPNAETAAGEYSAVDSADEAFFGNESLEVDNIDNVENEILEADGVELLTSLEVDDDVSAADILVSTVVSTEDPLAAPDDASISVEPADLKTSLEVTPDVASAVVVEASPDTPSQNPGKPTLASSLPLVLIDSDVTVLEWAKAALQTDYSRVHAFQQAEQGLARIRQYLIRGEFPVVLISTKIQIDPLSGIRGLSDFVSRLKAQATKLVVVGLREDDATGQATDSEQSTKSGAFDRIVSRPSGRALRAAGEALDPSASDVFARAVREALEARKETTSVRQSSGHGADNDVIGHLRDATTKLQDASSRGEILPVVLDFASEFFSRVAILIVREDQVFAIAGRGIDALEVDPLDSSSPVSLKILEGGWIRQVLDSGRPVEGPPATPADRDLLARFGGVEPAAAYLGPIESSGVTVAMLYCDQGSGENAFPDTSGLEVVLQHAGLALDRAALERALWEVDGQTH